MHTFIIIVIMLIAALWFIHYQLTLHQTTLRKWLLARFLKMKGRAIKIWVWWRERFL